VEIVGEADLKRVDVLALDRTKLAAERTLMAWVRTSLSMITFGFTIYKFLQAFQEQGKLVLERPNSPRNLGLILISIGTFTLVVACIQHWKYVARLRPEQPYKPWDLSFVVACLIGLLGFLMFGSMIFRSGPLG
jgi:putative membrane protein